MSTVLITGASRGIGRATAKAFANCGWDLLLISRSEEDIESLIKEIDNKKIKAFYKSIDLSNPNEISKGIVELMNNGLVPSVLINNASSFYPTPIEDASMDEWNNLMATNATTPLFLTQALLPFLKKGKGCIINISDTLAPSGIKKFSLYSGAKSALEGITKSLAKELAPDIRVNAISPGAILWPEDEDLSEDQQKQRLTKVPLGRIGCPEDISSLAVFLSEAEYITGQVIKVDGGRSIN